MSLIQCLCSFVLKQVSPEGVEGIAHALANHFSDQSQRLTRALERANHRAWDALHIALTGESFWNRFNRPEDRAFRQQLRQFFDQLPLPELQGKDDYRRLCLQDLHDARRKGVLFGRLVPEELAQRAGTFARYTDPTAILQVERRALLEMANELSRAGFKALGWLLGQPAHPGQSVLVVAVRFYFRREVASDEVLHRELRFAADEAFSKAQLAGFQQLEAVLRTHGQRVEEELSNLVGEINKVGNKVDILTGQVQQLLDHFGIKNLPPPDIGNLEQRFPSVLLLDVSKSMAGERIAELNEGIRAYQTDLRADSLTSQRVEVAVVAFGSGAELIRPFTEAERFQAPTLVAAGKTSLGAGINLTLDLLDQRKQQYRAFGLAALRPWVFLITDGGPTDQWEAAAARLRQAETRKALDFFAFGVEGANFKVLSALCARHRPPLRLKGLSSFLPLFKWLANSQRAVSRSCPGQEESVSLINPAGPNGPCLPVADLP